MKQIEMNKIMYLTIKKELPFLNYYFPQEEGLNGILGLNGTLLNTSIKLPVSLTKGLLWAANARP